MKLYTGPLSMFGAKAEIAAREKAIPIEVVMVPFDRDDRYEPRHPEVLRINPKRQVPVLVDGDVEIFDSTQIFEYLEDIAPQTPLWPIAPGDRARARQLEHLSDEVFFPPVIRLMGLQHDMQSEPARTACAACADFYLMLEKRLQGDDRAQAQDSDSDHSDHGYLAGSYSFADIAFYMAQVFAERKGAGMTGATPKLLAWRQRVGERVAVRAVVRPMMDFLASQGRPVPAYLQE